MNPYELHVGDCRDVLATLPAQSVQTCVTSPPYFGLRDYGHDKQIGMERTPLAYTMQLVDVFREVRRVLRDDGTLWLNLGDSYAGPGRTGGMASLTRPQSAVGERGWVPPAPGFKDKDLYGIPWRVALALQADGWYLRSDIIWHKPNPMPESVTDRPTKSHEYLFLLTKSERYHYDHAAISEPAVVGDNDSRFDNGKTAVHQGERMQRGPRFGGHKYGDSDDPMHATKSGKVYEPNGRRNKRTVWTVATQPYPEAHFATYPPELIRPCILAGSREGETVLDPFNGAGTTGLVALQMARRYVGIELNPEYAQLTRDRLDPIANQPGIFEAVA